MAPDSAIAPRGSLAAILAAAIVVSLNVGKLPPALPVLRAEFGIDLVTASLAIHNIPLAEDRAAAVREIERVLRPGGRVVIVDIAKTAEYVAVLTELGLELVEQSGRRFATYPPSRVIVARKPHRVARPR